MNGYTVLAESYKKLKEQGKITAEQAEAEIRVLEFLASCTQEDFCRMVDSTAFNDIIKAYFRKAVDNAELEPKARERVLQELRYTLDTVTAREIIEREG